MVLDIYAFYKMYFYIIIQRKPHLSSAVLMVQVEIISKVTLPYKKFVLVLQELNSLE